MGDIWIAVGAVFAIAVVAVLVRRGVLSGAKAEKAAEPTAK